MESEQIKVEPDFYFPVGETYANEEDQQHGEGVAAAAEDGGVDGLKEEELEMHQIDLDDSPVKPKTPTAEKPFRCKVCPQRFTQSHNLQSHYRRAHGVDPKGDPQKFRNMCQQLLQQQQQQQQQQPAKPATAGTSSSGTLPRLTPKPLGLWECCVCDEPFQDRDLLLIHEETHVPEAPFECRYCTTVYAGLINFRSHVNIHRVSLRQGGYSAAAARSHFQSGVRANASAIVAGRKPVENSGGESDVALNTNQPFVPSNDKNAPYKCVECKRNFQKQDLYSHMKVHLKQKNIFSKKSLKCEKCGRVFEKELTLKKHMDTVHPNVGSSASDANALLREALRDQASNRTASPAATTLKLSSEVDLVPIEPRVKQEVPESALGDDEVNSTVSDNPILTQLLNSNSQQQLSSSSRTSPVASGDQGDQSNDGGFVISAVATVDHNFLEQLDAMERNNSQVQQPMPTLRRMPVLEESLRRPPVGSQPADNVPAPLSSGTYSCVYCPRTFNEHFGFRQHMRSMHYNEKRHKCPECGKKFSLGITLATHMRIHTTVYPFTCIVCFKTFTRSTSLNGHLSMHSYGEVKCAECGVTQINVFNYMKHIEKFHPDFLRNIPAYRKKAEAMMQRRRELIVEITRGLAKHQSELPNVLARLRAEVATQPDESFKIKLGKPYHQEEDVQDEVTSSEGVQVKLEQPDSPSEAVSSASDQETLPALRAELRKRPLRNSSTVAASNEPPRKTVRTSAGASSPNLKRLLEATPLNVVKCEPSSD